MTGISALCLVLRDRLVSRWHDTQKRIRNQGSRKVYYLSLEFLMGRGMTNAAVNLDLDRRLRDMILEVGDTLEDVARLEGDAGLGNGGLGRLAACFLDSMATLDLAGFGYGIRYDYGLFRQEIGADGAQIEHRTTGSSSATCGRSNARISAIRSPWADTGWRSAMKPARFARNGGMRRSWRRSPTTRRFPATTPIR